MGLNITIITGNGIDISNGLATSYKNFKNNYMDKKTDKNNNLHNRIIDTLGSDPKKWEDMEDNLGKCTSFYPSGDVSNVQQFYNDLNDIRKWLKEYLREQEDRIFTIDYKQQDTNLKAFLAKFDTHLMDRDREKLNYFYERYWYCRNAKRDRVNDVNLNIINLNYTNTLEKLLPVYSYKNAFSQYTPFEFKYRDNNFYTMPTINHIHGTLEQDMIFGVNDSSQISVPTEFVESYSEYLIKKTLYAKSRTDSFQNAVEDIIDTNLFLLIGTSLGKTDTYLKKYVLLQLIRNPHALVVIYEYAENQDLTEIFIRDQISKNQKSAYKELLCNPDVSAEFKETKLTEENVIERILVVMYNDNTKDQGTLYFKPQLKKQ